MKKIGEDKKDIELTLTSLPKKSVVHNIWDFIEVYTFILLQFIFFFTLVILRLQKTKKSFLAFYFLAVSWSTYSWKRFYTLYKIYRENIMLKKESIIWKDVKMKKRYKSWLIWLEDNPSEKTHQQLNSLYSFILVNIGQDNPKLHLDFFQFL